MKNKKIILKILPICLVGAAIFNFMSARTTLKVSHQWPTTDVRHKVVQIVADEVKKDNVGLDLKVYPSSSLFKAKEQYRPLTRGQVDMIIFPLAYAAGQQPTYDLTLMPGLVKNHDHAARLTKSPFMKELEKIMASDNVMVLVHGYLAGGFAAKDKCITSPDDFKGLKIRAAGKTYEQMFAAAGASIVSMASSEVYSAMQTGVLNAVNTSSSSFVSYRIYEQVKCYTPAGDFALWFMYQPLLMNKKKFERLNKKQQNSLLKASKKAEEFYLAEAKKEDAASVDKFKSAGVDIANMTQKDFDEWQALAKTSSYSFFVKEAKNGQKLLDMALSVK